MARRIVAAHELAEVRVVGVLVPLVVVPEVAPCVVGRFPGQSKRVVLGLRPLGQGQVPALTPTGVCASALSGTVALSGGQVDQRVGGPVGCEQRRVDELQACHSHGVTLERSTKPRQPPGRLSGAGVLLW